MDDHNVHHFWGVSSALDLLGVPGLSTSSTPDGHSIALLQVCPYDCRHTLATLRTWASSGGHPCPLQLHVYEEHPEALARHILLLYVLLDPSLPPRERCEVFLELHGNALLRQKTADYLHAASKQLEAALVAAAGNAGGSSSSNSTDQDATQAAAVMRLFDLSCLKYRDIDDLVAAFSSCRSKKSFDVVKAWDTRSRRYYAERYDSRRNVVDWDYHMRLQSAGTPGLDPELGSVIHFYHFRHWRMTGVAYELRDSSYTCPNITLLSTAHGRTKEFKDRFGKDVGRSVAAAGYWANIVDPPYTSFGISTDDAELLKQANKQFTHTSVDVAEHNLLAILGALRGSSSSANGSSSSESESGGSGGHRARAARGPTDMAGLAAATAAAGDGSEAPLPEEQQAAEADKVSEDGDKAEEVAAAGVEQLSLAEGQQKGTVTASGSSSKQSGDRQGKGTEEAQAQVAAAGDATLSSSTPALSEQEAAQRAASAALDAEALRRLQAGVKITLHTGDAQKVLFGRAQYARKFQVVTVGHRHAHLLGEVQGVSAVTAPGGAVLAETGKYLLLLNKDKVGVFEDKIRELGVKASLEEQRPGKRQAAVSGNSSSGTATMYCQVVEEEEDEAASKDQGTQATSRSSSSSASPWHMGWYNQAPDAHMFFRAPGPA